MGVARLHSIFTEFTGMRRGVRRGAARTSAGAPERAELPCARVLARGLATQAERLAREGNPDPNGP
jgi:hypothetical protein